MKHTRIDLLKEIVKRHPDLSSYLEVGCRKDECFSQINLSSKVGVDFLEGGTHRMTSDDFFHTNDLKFDLIFIDGDHRCEQAFRDIKSSLECLKPKGILVAHDCFPPSKEYESEENIKCGNAWKTFVHFRRFENLRTACGDFDFGCGVILKGSNERIPQTLDVLKEDQYNVLTTKDLNYEDLQKNSNDWLNILKFEDLLEWIDTNR